VTALKLPTSIAGSEARLSSADHTMRLRLITPRDRFGVPRGIVVLGILGLFVLLLCIALATPGRALDRADVWFSPDDETPDLLDMFRHPELWAQARGQIGVFKFGPANVSPKATGPGNSYAGLKGIDAFAKLHTWGIKIAVEEGAIKPWDCTGRRAAQITANHIVTLAAAKAALQLVAMDGPLRSGQTRCGLSLEETANRTAAYVGAVTMSKEAGAAGATPIFGDIEPYPATSLATLIDWTRALERHGFKPAFLHLDINLHYVDVHPEIPLDADLRALSSFLHKAGIPLGVIFWGGYDPLNSDRAFYDHVLAQARRIKGAIGRPDQVIIQSWDTRSSIGCPRADAACARFPCTPADPPYCGKKSIPMNLPEQGPAAFTQTRLVSDVLVILNGR
jgi:hypothetical protein